MDSAKHEAFCGKPNEKILENAKFIAENAKEMIVRVPTVPTFNASETEIAAIARFAASLPNVKELHLLPYHRLGQDKYAGLGREYTLSHITPPTGEEMERLAAAARAAAPTLHVQIGG
jgi:pyruvate formate lyase activating enzyme